MTGTCNTCTKWVSDSRCAVLKGTPGETGSCWAWSDDPAWEERAEAATRAYAAWLKEKGDRPTPGLYRKMRHACPRCGRACTPYSFGLVSPGVIRALYACLRCGATWPCRWDRRRW